MPEAYIESFTDGMHTPAYVADARTQAAVERKFEIIGEVNRLLESHPVPLSETSG